MSLDIQLLRALLRIYHRHDYELALNYEDVKTICPSDIEISSVNTNVCCLSGPKASLKSFEIKLQVSYIFLEIAFKLQMKYILFN